MVWDRIKSLLFGNSEAHETSLSGSSWSIGSSETRHPYAIGPDHPAAQHWVNALEFHATFQLRTPKRILVRNGTRISLTDDPPSDFEPWMGVWLPIHTGHNILTEMAPEAWAEWDANRTVASDVGPVDPAEYMPFLIAFRTIVEDRDATIVERMAKIEDLFQRPEWAGFVAALPGAQRVISRFFPPVLSRIGGLPHSSQAALSENGIRTVAELRAADDATLLSIKGIGPAKLAAIQKFCEDFDDDPQADRLVDIAA